MKAIKANREYTITEDVKQSFVKDGYDIYDDKGNVIEYGAGKTVPFGKYVKVVEANKALEAEVEKLRKEIKKSAPKKSTKTKDE